MAAAWGLEPSYIWIVTALQCHATFSEGPSSPVSAACTRLSASLWDWVRVATLVTVQREPDAAAMGNPEGQGVCRYVSWGDTFTV